MEITSEQNKLEQYLLNLKQSGEYPCGKVIKIEYQQFIVVRKKQNCALYPMPIRKNTDIAFSWIGFEDYAYTHGGVIFKQAIEKAKELNKNKRSQ